MSGLFSWHVDDPHYITRSGWLRAAVLGANDGIVSISSLIMGVASAGTGPEAVFLAGFAGLAAGALSMAAGEYVSVSSQSDIEHADIAREKRLLNENPHIELKELVTIYEARGLSPDTARLVARELTEHDALGTHLRDELGMHHIHAANPVQAALASGATFTVAGAVPLLVALLASSHHIMSAVLFSTLLALASLGAAGARAGGAPVWRAVLRVVCWGSVAMATTAGIGKLFQIIV